MMFEAAYRKRVNQTYQNMTARARPRLWKSGKNKGKVRIPGLSSLPFWPDELWAHVIKQVPAGGAQCPYCADYGRTTIIYLDMFVLDHHVPLKHGGSWELSNLVCCCAECNRLKGSLSYTAFIVLLRDFLPDFDAIDQKYVISCLKTHGQVVRSWSKSTPERTVTIPKISPQRMLDDDF